MQYKQHIQSEEHSEHYGILCQSLTEKNLSKASVTITHCSIPPLGHTLPHSHREAERFVILEGEGLLIRNNTHIEVQAGDIVWMQAFCFHELKNTSSSKTLHFLSVYSEAPDVKKIPEQVVITVAPPTPNGELHLGHLGGPYIAADIHRRFYTMLGSKVALMGGTDDFQNYIARKSREVGQTSQELTQNYREKIAKAFKLADIPLDFFLSPSTDNEYQSFVQTFFSELLEKNVFELKERSYFYIPEEKRYAYESEIQGLCALCQNLTVGNCCEECGAVVDVAFLQNPQHVHGKVLELKYLMGYSFTFGQHLDTYLLELQARGGNIQRVQQLLENLRSHPELLDYPVTYPQGDWGIPVKNDSEGRIINVWVEMAASYVYLSQKSEMNFLKAEGADWYHAFGFDNSYYYTFLIPALLTSHTPEFEGPKVQLSNEFLLLDGKKFSTSRKHALWANEILEKFPSDLVRFFLAYQHPSFEQTNFSMLEFEKFINSIHSRLEKLFQHQNLCKGTLERGKNLNVFEQKIILDMNEALVRYEQNFLKGNLALRKNTRLILDFLEIIEEILPSSSTVALLGLRVWGALIGPFMPQLSSSLLSHFDLKQVWIQDLQMTGETYDGKAFEAFKLTEGRNYAHN